MKNKNSLFLLILSFAAIGCASGHCRGRKINEVALTTVKVFKADGAVQCKKNSGASVEQMGLMLEGIKVVSSEKKSDGKMRMAVCGASAGQINVYEIPAADVDKAKTLGFEVLKEEIK
jgi:hypothetical protein